MHSKLHVSKLHQISVLCFELIDWASLSGMFFWGKTETVLGIWVQYKPLKKYSTIESYLLSCPTFLVYSGHYMSINSKFSENWLSILCNWTGFYMFSKCTGKANYNTRYQKNESLTSSLWHYYILWRAKLIQEHARKPQHLEKFSKRQWSSFL